MANRRDIFRSDRLKFGCFDVTNNFFLVWKSVRIGKIFNKKNDSNKMFSFVTPLTIILVCWWPCHQLWDFERNLSLVVFPVYLKNILQFLPWIGVERRVCLKYFDHVPNHSKTIVYCFEIYFILTISILPRESLLGRF